MARVAFVAWVALLAVLPAAAQERQYLAPDRPTPVGGTFLFPWRASFHEPAGYGTAALDVPGTPDVDGLHRLSHPGQWLFSLTSDVPAGEPLGASIGGPVDRRDVIRFDGATGYGYLFCGASVSGAVPPSSNVDAFYLTAGDGGDLVVSFDVDTTIGGQTYEPADLVRYVRTGDLCSSWDLVGLELDATGHVPSTGNFIGAALSPGEGIVLSVDDPTELTPSSGPGTYGRDDLVLWDGATFSLIESLPGWPLASRVAALSLPQATCTGFPGADPGDGLVDICTFKWPTDIGEYRARLEWSAEAGALGYNVYRTTLSGLPSLDLECISPPGGTTDRQLVLPEDPLPGDGFFYLATVELPGGEGSLGPDGAGGTRPNDQPCP